MPLSAIAFDLDGTLIDSLPDLTASANATRAYYGMPPLSKALIKTFIGDGVVDLVRRTLNGDKDSPAPNYFDDALAYYREHYRTHLYDNTVLYPNVFDTLHSLADRGIPMAIVTNKPEAQARALLKHFALLPLFKAVYGGDTLPVRKPDPTPVLAAIRDMGATPESTLMVGDSPNDILSGKAAGCATFLLHFGYGDIAAMLQDSRTIPDYQADDFAALLTFFDKCV